MTQWFGPKRIGYGIGPRSWQGWLATALLVAAIAGVDIYFRASFPGLPHWTKAAATGGLLLAFMILIYFTYEKDRN